MAATPSSTASVTTPSSTNSNGPSEPPFDERVDWSAVRIAQVSHPDLRELVGRSIAELAAEAGQSPLTVVSDTLIADRLTTLVDRPS